MGVATMEPGEIMGEHYHPYSEEFAYVTRGELTAEIDGESHTVRAGEAFYLPLNTRHRLRNDGDEQVELVFHLGPLAPRPELGHVDTEPPAPTPAAEGTP
jgi:putative monooxygenase